RELLQENRVLANIKQNSIKKILNAIKKLAGEDAEIFITQYNKVIKEGIYMDQVNKDTLLEIVRYKSSTESGLISFADYISRGDSDKKEIYYITGESEAVLRNSPLLEAYKQSNIEVLIMDDHEIDEIVTPMISTYKEWSLKDITTVEAPDSKTDEEKEEMTKEFKTLTDKIKEALGDEVKEVKISTRLTTSPSCVLKDSSDPMAGMSAMFAQMGQDMPEVPLILEINPEHDMIKKLDSLDNEELFNDVSWILLDSAKLSEGLEPKDKSAFATRVSNVATQAL
ncbi:MAG: molecular chaperone HtpG, partial [Sulfurovum sp.]|nr:molecular chaperone HtpG [Sulfurovaceae bacterium]